MNQQQNAEAAKNKQTESTPAETEDQKPQIGFVTKKILGKKKTITDKKGDEWEVVDKRDTFTIKKPVNSDSDSGSELSFD